MKAQYGKKDLIRQTSAKSFTLQKSAENRVLISVRTGAPICSNSIKTGAFSSNKPVNSGARKNYTQSAEGV